MNTLTSKYNIPDNEVDRTFDEVTGDIIDLTELIKNKVIINAEHFYTGWKKFVFKENIINIAVGMIIARSFKNTVNSLVVDIIMPIIIGFGVGANVEDLFIILSPGKNTVNNTYITLKQAQEDGAVTINYGLFINIFFDLVFVTLFLYASLRATYKLKDKVNKKILKKKLKN
ncbi:MAG: hypothetical protein CBB97_21120 [Candidatus Endolissoclinum sp. TMED37]|nr:MAG: hypothetical protein CBB97_21120 [Candidatus Endolissoclinum sp. TMED37]